MALGLLVDSWKFELPRATVISFDLTATDFVPLLLLSETECVPFLTSSSCDIRATQRAHLNPPLYAGRYAIGVTLSSAGEAGRTNQALSTRFLSSRDVNRPATVVKTDGLTYRTCCGRLAICSTKNLPCYRVVLGSLLTKETNTLLASTVTLG